MESSKKSVASRPAGRPRGTGTGPARELTPDEVVRLTRCALSARDRALVWLCLGGGLRIGEACSLRLVDLASDGSVLVEASRAKSQRSRRVYLVPEARKHLAAWLAERPSDAGAALFLGRDRAGGLHPNWAVQHVQALLRAAGIAGATSHSLRRTHANTLRRHGVDLVVIQGQLGHASLSTTAVYMGASEVERASAVARIRF
jgi:integrase/recombinase XerD